MSLVYPTGQYVIDERSVPGLFCVLKGAPQQRIYVQMRGQHQKYTKNVGEKGGKRRLD